MPPYLYSFSLGNVPIWNNFLWYNSTYSKVEFTLITLTCNFTIREKYYNMIIICTIIMFIKNVSTFQRKMWNHGGKNDWLTFFIWKDTRQVIFLERMKGKRCGQKISDADAGSTKNRTEFEQKKMNSRFFLAHSALWIGISKKIKLGRTD